MKSVCFALLLSTLFCAVARADDAKKLGVKCPVQSKFFKKYLDAKEFLKYCPPGMYICTLGAGNSLYTSLCRYSCIFFLADKKVTSNRCDKCFQHLVKSFSKGAPEANLDIPKILGLLVNQNYTLEQKFRAVAEACSPKIAKALLEKGVKKDVVKKATDYPDGNVFKCPADLVNYPRSLTQLIEILLQDFGPILGSLLP